MSTIAMSGRATSTLRRGLGDRRRAVGRLADDVVPVGLEERASGAAESGVVVDDQDGPHHLLDRRMCRASAHRGEPSGTPVATKRQHGGAGRSRGPFGNRPRRERCRHG